MTVNYSVVDKNGVLIKAGDKVEGLVPVYDANISNYTNEKMTGTVLKAENMWTSVHMEDGRDKLFRNTFSTEHQCYYTVSGENDQWSLELINE